MIYYLPAHLVLL